MSISSRSRRYSIRERTEQRDARGERAQVYKEKTKTWGEPPREGTTSLASDVGATRSTETLRFRISFVPNVRVGDRIVDLGNEREFDIVNVADVPGRYRLELQLVVTQSPAEGS